MPLEGFSHKLCWKEHTKFNKNSKRQNPDYISFINKCFIFLMQEQKQKTQNKQINNKCGKKLVP